MCWHVLTVFYWVLFLTFLKVILWQFWNNAKLFKWVTNSRVHLPGTGFFWLRVNTTGNRALVSEFLFLSLLFLFSWLCICTLISGFWLYLILTLVCIQPMLLITGWWGPIVFWVWHGKGSGTLLVFWFVKYMSCFYRKGKAFEIQISECICDAFSL